MDDGCDCRSCRMERKMRDSGTLDRLDTAVDDLLRVAFGHSEAMLRLSGIKTGKVTHGGLLMIAAARLWQAQADGDSVEEFAVVAAEVWLSEKIRTNQLRQTMV